MQSYSKVKLELIHMYNKKIEVDEFKTVRCRIEKYEICTKDDIASKCEINVSKFVYQYLMNETHLSVFTFTLVFLMPNFSILTKALCYQYLWYLKTSCYL